MASLQHILAAEPPEEPQQKQDIENRPTLIERPLEPPSETIANDESLQQKDANLLRKAPGALSSIAGSLDKNAAQGALANKMRHLKKEDGIPLWRKDIQYDFLKLVFYDQKRVFTKFSEKQSGFTFAEVYIDAMAKSSKCSKILKEKLLSDIDGAISMAMVCLLVNLGRMNTTLNFFPEMRAQLRTYHSIPALQAHQDPNAYKQLQDAPRLKSILKGATEDEPQPWSMDEIKTTAKPRTNAVNLIFLLSQGATKISDIHFNPPRDFFDLIMRPTLSSESRARAFLWLLWWYLESDFTKEDSINNPFGPGQYGDTDDKDGIPLKVPPLASLTEEQAEQENVDTEEEKLFGEVKRKARIAILASEPSPAMVALKRARKGKGEGYRSDDDMSETGWYNSGNDKATSRRTLFDNDSVHTRSPSPATGRKLAGTPDVRIHALLNNEDVDRSTARKGPGRGNWRRNRGRIEGSNRNSNIDPHHFPILPNTNEAGRGVGTPGSVGYNAYSSFPLHGSPSRVDHVPTPSYQAQKRHRGVTQHQSALINHRRAQMDYMLDRTIQRIHTTARQAREHEGSILRAWKRMRRLPPDYDSEEEFVRSRRGKERDREEEGRVRKDEENAETTTRSSGLYLAGYVMPLDDGDGDVGEEAKSMARTLRRLSRRLERWQEDGLPGDSMIRRKEAALRGNGSKRKKSRNRDLAMAGQTSE